MTTKNIQSLTTDFVAIPGFEGIYKARIHNNQLEVHSCPRTVFSLSGPRHYKGKNMKINSNNQVRLSSNGVSALVHSFSIMVACGFTQLKTKRYSYISIIETVSYPYAGPLKHVIMAPRMPYNAR